MPNPGPPGRQVASIADDAAGSGSLLSIDGGVDHKGGGNGWKGNGVMELPELAGCGNAKEGRASSPNHLGAC